MSMCKVATGQTPPEYMNGFLGKIFKSCGEQETYYYGPIAVPEVVCDLNSRNDDCKAVREFKGATFHIEKPSDADRLNGKSVVAMTFSVTRIRVISRGVWSGWGEYQDRQKPYYRVGELWNRNGTWSAHLLDDFLPMGFLSRLSTAVDPRIELTVDQVKSDEDKVSCEDIKNAKAGATAPKGLQKPPPAAQDGFKYLNDMSSEERQFTGNVEEFARAFPEIMDRVVSGSGLFQKNWDKEVAYVIAAARTCEGIIPQVAQKIRSLTALQGTKDEACRDTINVSEELNRNANLQTRRGIGMNVRPVGGIWQNSAGKFVLKVGFTRLPSDNYVDKDYTIVTATINPTPLSNESVAATVTGAPIPAKTLPPPAYRTLDPASYKQLDGSKAGPGMEVSGVILDLNLIHLQPSVLNDAKFLNYFIRLNNCGNFKIDAQIGNEFVYPRMAAFYKDNAGEMLKRVPSELGSLTFWRRVTLGEYDLSRKAFPLTTALRIDHFDTTRKTCVSTEFSMGMPVYQVSVSPISLRELPVDEFKAREYAAGNRGPRNIVLKFDLEIIQQQPTSLNNKIVFFGRIKKVTAVQSPNWPTALAVLSPGDAGFPPAGDTDRVVDAPQNALTSQRNQPSISSNSGAYSDINGRRFLQDLASCNAGNAGACQVVGYLYDRGRGVDRNIEMARQYYQKSCAMGNTGGCSSLKSLNERELRQIR